ncbi:hypothetical protein AB4156_13550 [Cupriavidus sp. 2MCAB6]|uniref:hypothetical protein n=1 Tax=Cupriavidus sp. 2MCAB6 TaxID=3232981 RepID=UPI003F930C84
MQYFAFGIISVFSALLFPAIYLAGYGLRRIGAWFNRADPPRDRVGAYVIAALLFGFLVGSLLQPLWDCLQTGESLGTCVMRHSPTAGLGQ